MAKAKVKQRKDSKGRVLQKGESQRKLDGMYIYTYVNPYGKRCYVYSKDLFTLREKEQELIKAQMDGLDYYVGGHATINMTFDRYMSTKHNLRETTRSNYLYMFNRFIREDFGNKFLTEVKYTDVKLFYYHLLNEKDIAINTLDTIHTVLHPIFDMAVRDDIINKNPTDGVLAEIKRNSGKNKGIRHALTIEQQQAFMDTIRTVELFAGVGGFRLGLEAASDRFKVIWANQWEPSMREQYAFECYTTHFGNKKYHVCQDIAKAKIDVPDHDLLVGGFPCQDYSIMKKNSAGIKGTKGALWWQIDDILREKKPKYVLLENVDRLIRSPAKQSGRDFSIILRCLYEKGYAVEWRVINAADYGYAQRRRRTFIMAYHNQTEIFRNLAEAVCVQGLKSMHKHVMENGILAKAFPVQNHSRSYVESWIDELEYADISTVSRNQRVYLYNAGVMMNGRIYSVDVTPQRVEATPLKDILETGPVDEHYFLRTEDMPRWTYSKGAKREKRQRQDGRQYYFSEGSVQFPESLEKPSRTMLTSESQVGRTSHVIQDPMTGRLRVLTPIECERLNGFPADWTDTGMPERMRYFCMGNALVVPLVKRIGDALLNAGI